MPRDLTLYWWAQTTSAFGSMFTAIAMPVLAVVYLDASPGQISLISAAAILPVLLLGVPAGALADRFTHPRRVLMALDALSAVAVGAVALAVSHQVASIGALAALSAVQGCVAILSGVVYFIHLSQLTDLAGLGRARARLQAGQFGAGFVGRLLAGPTIVAFGGAAALWVDVVSYLLSAAALLSMRPAAAIPVQPAASTGLSGMAAGVRFFVGDAFHRALLAFIVAPVAAAAGIGALTAPFLLRVVGVPTAGFGLIFAVSGLMGLAGSVVAARLLRPDRDPRLVTLLSFTASVAAAALLPVSFGPPAVAATLAALGVGLPVFFGAIANVALSPVIVTDASEHTVGRTVATLQVFAAAAGLLGALAGGALGDWIGERAAIWVMIGLALAAIAASLPAAWGVVRARPALSAVEEHVHLAGSTRH